MFVPSFGALRREILIGWPQADVFDCSRSARHVFMHVQAFTASTQRCVCEIVRLKKCIGSCDIHSREIRKYVYHCQVLRALHFASPSRSLCLISNHSRFSGKICIIRVLTVLCDVCNVDIILMLNLK